MTEAEILARVTEKFGTRLVGTTTFRSQCAVLVRPDSLRELLVFLREDPALAFDMMSDLTGVDYLGYPDWENDWRFEVVYQLTSLAKNHRFRVKVVVTDDTVEVPSIWDLWGLANWMEREVYDMYGVRFSGHPNLRRILCHDQFEGHALRKDYPINKRQKLSEPTEIILCEKSEYA